MPDSILSVALAATTIAKVIVDIARQVAPLPGWSLPILALLFGIAAAFLLLIASGTAITAPMAAQATLAGILAAGGAVGVTELQKRV